MNLGRPIVRYSICLLLPPGYSLLGKWTAHGLDMAALTFFGSSVRRGLSAIISQPSLQESPIRCKIGHLAFLASQIPAIFFAILASSSAASQIWGTTNVGRNGPDSIGRSPRLDDLLALTGAQDLLPLGNLLQDSAAVHSGEILRVPHLPTTRNRH